MAIKINFKYNREKELKLKDLPIGYAFKTKDFTNDQVYIKIGVIEDEISKDVPSVECIILGSTDPKTCCSEHLIVTPVDLDITVTSVFE